jgi:predicted aminopeptidase
MPHYRFAELPASFPRLIAISAVGLVLCACSSVRYYAQAAHGQSELVFRRRAVSAIVQDPATNPRLAERLRLAQKAREFASQRLGLPDNRSYTNYVDLHREYVVWNVFAAPRYSVDPVLYCFPIAGCVAYRGYFNEAAAKAEVTRLQQLGYDVEIGGVPAYSTLGWFADPILSSMLRWDDDELDSTIFHELAHQLIYVKDDTAFNESYATFVQTEGLREWRQSRALAAQDDRTQAMDAGFTQLVLDLRERLKVLYASGVGEPAMEAGKQREIAMFRQQYQQWRDHDWPQEHAYDGWVAAPINNARLLPFGLYDQWTPSFGVLFKRAEGSWPAFYASVRALAKLPKAQRQVQLQALLADSHASATSVPPSVE